MEGVLEAPDAYRAFQAGDNERGRKLLGEAIARCELARRRDGCIAMLQASMLIGQQVNDWTGAARDGEKALTTSERVFGISSPVTTGIANALMVSYNRLGLQRDGEERLAESETAMRRALEIADRWLPETDYTTTILENLGALLGRQWRWSEGEPFLRRVLAHRIARFGTEHGDAMIARNHLARNLNAQLQFAEAARLYKDNLDIRLRRVAKGAGDPLLVLALYNYAYTLDDMGEHAAAEPIHRRALAYAEQGAKMTEGAIDLTMARANLARNLVFQRRYAEAEPLLRLAQQFRATRYDPTARDSIDGDWQLAQVVKLRGVKPDEARHLLRSAERKLRARLDGFRDFGALGQAEIRQYRPIFSNIVEVAWALSRCGSGSQPTRIGDASECRR